MAVIWRRSRPQARRGPRPSSSMEEQWTFNPLVQGSSPWGGTATSLVDAWSGSHRSAKVPTAATPGPARTGAAEQPARDPAAPTGGGTSGGDDGELGVDRSEEPDEVRHRGRIAIDRDRAVAERGGEIELPGDDSDQ